MTGYKYTDSEIKALLKSLIIIADTHEKENTHILLGIEKQGFKWRSRALESGDYSCILPQNIELGIVRDIYFDKKIFIERKNSLEELSGNLAQARQRFENEMIRAKACEKHLVIEGGSWIDIINGVYSTEFNPLSFYRSLLSFINKYGLIPHFIPKEKAATHIVNLLGIYVKNYLQG